MVHPSIEYGCQVAIVSVFRHEYASYLHFLEIFEARYLIQSDGCIQYLQSNLPKPIVLSLRKPPMALTKCGYDLLSVLHRHKTRPVDHQMQILLHLRKNHICATWSDLLRNISCYLVFVRIHLLLLIG